jgi:hypothetical protein
VVASAAIALWLGAGSALSPALDVIARARPAVSTPDAIGTEVAIDALATEDVAGMLSVVEEDPDAADDISVDDASIDDIAADDLAWIDGLDEASVDELVRWLDSQPG